MAEQVVPTTLNRAWAFFSDARNLKNITPEEMNFVILSDLGDGKVYPGMLIHYKVSPLLNIPLRWTTEITNVKEGEYFIDEQRFGPFAMWHHEHYFKEVEGGVYMRDQVDYAIPFGPLGRLAHAITVKNRVKEIFEYRNKKLQTLFPARQPQMGNNVMVSV